MSGFVVLEFSKETTLPAKSSDARELRARAELSIKKEEQAKDRAKAMMEYLANGQMVRERTERLRALRLAKEVADRKAELAGKVAAIEPKAFATGRSGKVSKRKAERGN